jgi:hypothetical protein
MLRLLMSAIFFWANHICGNIMFFMSLNNIVSLLLWGSTPQDIRGGSKYHSTKTVPHGNLSYCKIHPLQSLFKGCTEGHYNHCNLNTFYPAEEYFQRERRYCFFTYNGAYTMPSQAQRQQVGGTDSMPPTIGLRSHGFSNSWYCYY